MKNNKKNPVTFDQHLGNLEKKKEQLPFHKMDDLSRRKFIQSVSIFMGALSIPSMIRLETMSKISKKLFGSSMAFAQESMGATPIKLAFYARAGYGFVPWVVGCASDNDPDGNPTDRNVPWGLDMTTEHVTAGGLPLILPPHASGLAAYANSIQGIQCFQSMGGHTANFNGTSVMGSCELISATAKTQIDGGLQTLLTQPFGYYANASFGLQDVPASLAPYTPSTFNNIANVANLFTPPTLRTTQNNQLNNSLKNSIFSAMRSQFTKDIDKAIYETNKEIIGSSNEQAYKILATNYQQQLDPTQNTAIVNQLTAGLPAQVRASTNVNAAHAIYQIITAANLGITPRVGVIGFNGGDWHNDSAIPVNGNVAAADDRSESGAFFAVLMKNVLDTVNNGAWTNSVTGGDEIVRIICASEFTRTETSNDGTDNGDGSTTATLVLSSNTTNPGFKPGSYGKVAPSGQAMGYNPANNTHSSNIAKFTTMQAFVHNAQLFGVDPADFNVSGSGIGGGMVSSS